MSNATRKPGMATCLIKLGRHTTASRYMNHELMTMWLSVDPMTDKYPNISPIRLL